MAALVYAAQNGHRAASDVLIPYEKSHKDNDTYTALMYASKGGHVGTVKTAPPHVYGAIEDSWNRTTAMLAATGQSIRK